AGAARRAGRPLRRADAARQRHRDVHAEQRRYGDDQPEQERRRRDHHEGDQPGPDDRAGRGRREALLGPALTVFRQRAAGAPTVPAAAPILCRVSTEGPWGGGTPAGVPQGNDSAGGPPVGGEPPAAGEPPVSGPAPAPAAWPPPGVTPPGATPPPGAALPPGFPAPQPPPRQRPPFLIITVVVAVLLVLVGVPVLVFVLRSSPTPHRSATAAAASASPSPSPTPMSPEQYQKVLDDLARSLGAKFGALGADRTPDQLRMDVVSMRDELSGSFNILQTATPPPQVRPAHDQLLTALTQLSEIVNEVVTAAGNAELCGGSSALSRIT